MINPRVLIIEDGDEYLENLSRFVVGPIYIQVHTGKEALACLNNFHLKGENIDMIYLDMRFDRIPNLDLIGDHVQSTKDHNGDPVKGWKFLQNNQGLFILEFLRQNAYGKKPIILAYDFSRQIKRYEHLKNIHPTLKWVSDAVSPDEIKDLMSIMLNL